MLVAFSRLIYYYYYFVWHIAYRMLGKQRDA